MAEPGAGWEPRYVLMRHDPTGKNHEYIVGYLTLVAEFATSSGEDGVDVLRVSPDPSGTQDQAAVEGLADYTLTRLRGGLEARSGKVLTDEAEAVNEAQRVVRTLNIREHKERKARLYYAART